jgi:cell division protein FtsZ
LISSLSSEEEVAPAPVKPAAKVKRAPRPAPEPEPIVPPAPPIWEEREEPSPVFIAEEPAPIVEPAVFAPELIEVDEPAPLAQASEESFVEEAPPQPRVILPKKKPLPFKEPKPVVEKKPHAKQEVMQFEPVTRGRFEKSEPTIVEGQDLDVPTFLRKNVRVK